MGVIFMAMLLFACIGLAYLGAFLLRWLRKILSVD